jgi:hypothetical protein
MFLLEVPERLPADSLAHLTSGRTDGWQGHTDP